MANGKEFALFRQLEQALGVRVHVAEGGDGFIRIIGGEL